MSQYKKDSTIAPWALCAVIFGTFTYLYVYHYQTPTLAYLQHVYSGGVTVYRPIVSTVIVLAIGFVVQLCTFLLTRLHGASHALTYLPSMLLLTLLTSASPDGQGGIKHGWWIWTIPVILLLYYCLIRVVKQWINTPKQKMHFLVSHTLMINLLTMICMMMFVLNLGNGDELFHRQIRAERMLLKGQYAELEKEMNKPYEYTNKTLTLYRFIAMSHTGSLAKEVFTKPVIGETASLTLLKDVHPMLCNKDSLKHYLPFVVLGKATTVSDYLKSFNTVNDAERTPNSRSFDYLLCALLAERNIDTFARVLSSHVNVNDTSISDSIPRHYKEALILYQHLRSNPQTSYQNQVLETDYQDMRNMLRECANEEERHFKIKKQYANSYWSYYEN